MVLLYRPLRVTSLRMMMPMLLRRDDRFRVRDGVLIRTRRFSPVRHVVSSRSPRGGVRIRNGRLTAIPSALVY